MKLELPQVHIEGSKPLKDMSFGIKSNDMGLILEILRKKMYQDPISSIVREYACNALDAHREVGKSDTPIEISLPSLFDKHLKIKDFGPGITLDRMEDIFINYGSSSKRALKPLSPIPINFQSLQLLLKMEKLFNAHT